MVKKKYKFTKINKRENSSKSKNDNKNKNKKLIKKIKKKRIKKRISCHLKYLKKNPSINHFNINSFFIYDLDEIEQFVNKTNNKNLLKVNPQELSYLNQIIENIDLNKESDKGTIFITLKKEIFDKIINYTKIKEINDPLSSFIKSKFEEEENRNLYSCRKLATMFFEETGKKTNRTSINKIIRDKFGYRYLKTVLKNRKIKETNNRLISFAFIKIIIKSIIKGFKIIYIDESTIKNKNNNFRCFRKPEEQIYFNYEKCDKLNLIMAIDNESVIYYEITEGTTTQDSFYTFMEKLLNKIKEKNLGKYAIVMDNLSCHKTEKLIRFYKENNINIIYNSPYLSQWNAIELTFRAIKKIYYKKLFSSSLELKNYIEEIINGEELSKTLILNYNETLKEYRKFIIENKDVNLNSLCEE